MPLELYPSIVHEGDLSPDAVGDDINETVEVRTKTESNGRKVVAIFECLTLLVAGSDDCFVSSYY